ncbi:MAG: DNA pilot protein [Microvirus sp.]|nr:MAG: DNA pilot protein [Microvirus sp.]
MGNLTDNQKQQNMNWIAPAISAGSNLLGTGMGLLLEKHNDRRQLEQQQKLQNMQMEGNKAFQQWQNEQSYEMWKKTGPIGQVQQLNEAGLNPALMYGMGGGTGGQTTAGGGSLSGAQAPTGGGEMNTQMALQLQRALQAAQVENIQANTKKTNVEAENAILDSVGKDYEGREKRDYYENVKKPNRGIEAKTYENELEARQAVATNIYDMWLNGQLAQKSTEEVENLVLTNAKTREEKKNIMKMFDILSANLEGKNLENEILKLEKELQQKTGLDKGSDGFLKVLGRLLISKGGL